MYNNILEALNTAIQMRTWHSSQQGGQSGSSGGQGSRTAPSHEAARDALNTADRHISQLSFSNTLVSHVLWRRPWRAVVWEDGCEDLGKRHKQFVTCLLQKRAIELICEENFLRMTWWLLIAGCRNGGIG